MQLLSLILFIGLIFKASGFLVRDELLLRVLVAIGMTCDILFYTFQPTPIWESIVANALLASINVAVVVFIIFERTTLYLTAEQKALFRAFPTLKPGQFRRILRHCKWEEATGRVQLTTEGQELDFLYYVMADQFEITKQGQSFTAYGPAFVGELMFLNGGSASASVTLNAGAEYVAFDSVKLRKTMQRSAPLNNAMIALFGKDMARKVANSVPFEDPRSMATMKET